MSFININPSNVVIPESIVDFLHGKAGFCMQSSYISDIEGMIKPTKPLYSYREIKGKVTGQQFNAPMVLFRKSITEPFSRKYKFELTSRLGRKESYKIRTPPQQGLENLKSKYVVAIKILDDELESKALIKIDNIICMAIEFTMLSEFAKFYYSKCSTDKELIEGLFKKISPKHYDELLALLDENYYKLVQNPPSWDRSEGASAGNMLIHTEDPDHFLSLFNLIYATGVFKASKKNISELQTDIINNLFDGSIKASQFAKFINHEDNNIVPQAKVINYEITKENCEESDLRTMDECRYLFYVERKGTDAYNPKFPENLYTKEISKGNQVKPLTGETFDNLIGLNNVDRTKPNIFDGFIWCVNSIDLTKYKTFQVHSSWRVCDLILRKSKKSFNDSFKIDEGYFDELKSDSEDEESATINPTDKPQIIDSAAAAAALGDLDEV